MGLSYNAYLDCSKIYGCKSCKAHLADHEQIVSRNFRGQHGKAYLFNTVVNIETGEPAERNMTTGRHVVRDITCRSCGETVGWKYDRAFEATERYKEGKFILEAELLCMVSQGVGPLEKEQEPPVPIATWNEEERRYELEVGGSMTTTGGSIATDGSRTTTGGSVDGGGGEGGGSRNMQSLQTAVEQAVQVEDSVANRTRAPGDAVGAIMPGSSGSAGGARVFTIDELRAQARQRRNAMELAAAAPAVPAPVQAANGGQGSNGRMSGADRRLAASAQRWREVDDLALRMHGNLEETVRNEYAANIRAVDGDAHQHVPGTRTTITSGAGQSERVIPPGPPGDGVVIRIWRGRETVVTPGPSTGQGTTSTARVDDDELSEPELDDAFVEEPEEEPAEHPASLDG